MSFEGVTDLMVGMFKPVVLIFCLCIGYILKHWIKDVSNKWIPTILAILGGITACLLDNSVDFYSFISGVLTGLASIGFHQLFKQFIEKE